MDGVIAATRVVAGQVVGPSDKLFEIIDPTSLLVEALVFDQIDPVALLAGAPSACVGGFNPDETPCARTHVYKPNAAATWRVRADSCGKRAAGAREARTSRTSRRTRVGTVAPLQSVSRTRVPARRRAAQ